MRLTPHEIAAIRECAAAHFGEGTVVRLFGSRTDDTRRGGDIDLHITPKLAPLDEFRAECDFKESLQDRIGEQRIDVLVARRDRSPLPIEQIALQTGLLLPANTEIDVSSAGSISKSGSGPMTFHAEASAILAEAISSGEATKSKLARLLDDLAPFCPFEAGALAGLDWEVQLRTDSLLLSYTNLCAVVQDQMIRSILVLAGESLARMSRLDERNVVEKIGALPDGIDLQRIAGVRNGIAHHYPERHAFQASVLNDVVRVTPMLVAAFDGLALYARRFAPDAPDSPR